jgi:hypothetical protein
MPSNKWTRRTAASAGIVPDDLMTPTFDFGTFLQCSGLQLYNTNVYKGLKAKKQEIKNQFKET